MARSLRRARRCPHHVIGMAHEGRDVSIIGEVSRFAPGQSRHIRACLSDRNFLVAFAVLKAHLRNTMSSSEKPPGLWTARWRAFAARCWRSTASATSTGSIEHPTRIAKGRGRAEVLRNVGHVPFREDEEHVLDMIRRFLSVIKRVQRLPLRWPRPDSPTLVISMLGYVTSSVHFDLEGRTSA